jgi:NAD(P)-dependent dehydrogenase (short-subunit alcohol dehydrogenase family)
MFSGDGRARRAEALGSGYEGHLRGLPANFSRHPGGSMTERFAGRVALVTGATRGIGAAIVRRLVREGAQVGFCGRTEAAGAQLVAELGGSERVLYVAADLAQGEDCARVVDATVERFGRLDILVNNAASVLRGTLESTSSDDFDAMMALNLRAPFLTMQRALPTFKAQFEREGAGGVILNIGSINSYIGAENLMAYSASKGGLLTLSRNLAGALSPWRIRVHIFNVGWVHTEGEEVVQRNEGAPEDWAERAGATRPWNRLMNADDIANAVAFYASDEARVFSGGAIALEQHPF